LKRSIHTYFASPRRGFALLITVTLLAFLVLLLVSLASLTRVETQVAGNSQKIVLARQNAQFALNLAIGNLQVAAGKDRRVTATSGAFAPSGVTVHASKKNWTGAWNSETSTTPSFVGWLVSNTSASTGSTAASAPAIVGTAVGNSVVILGTGTLGSSAPATDQVLVERRDIPSSNIPGLASATSVTVGQYAWWISDEGVKLNLATPSRIDQLVSADAGFTDDADRNRIAQRIAHRVGAETFSEFSLKAEDDSASLARWQALRQVITSAQLKFTSALGINAAAQDYLSLHSHDFTTCSYGVLADSSPAASGTEAPLETSMIRGGLRKNLSDSANGETLPQVLLNFIKSRPYSTGSSSLPEIRIDSYAAKEHPLCPLVTEVAVDFVPYRRESDNKLMVKARVKVEIANPYSLPIQNKSTTPSAYDGFRVILNNLPRITVNLLSPTIDLNRVFDPALNSQGTALPISTPLAPGEVRVLSTETDYATSITLSGTTATLDYTVPAITATSANFGTDGFGLSLRINDAAKAELCNFLGVSYAAGSRSGIPAIIVATDTLDDVYRQRGFSYHVRLNPAVKSWRDWTRSSDFDSDAPLACPINLQWKVANLLTTHNIPWATTRTFKPADSYDTVMGPLNSASGYPYSPIDLANTAASQFALSEFFSRARLIPVIYDQPVGSLFSIGELTHLPLSPLGVTTERWLTPNTRHMAFSVGRPEGGKAVDGPNALFDRAFFAAVPATWQPGKLLPDYRLQPVAHSTFGSPVLADLQGQDAALFLLSQGAFNINSTSVPAWRGLLARAIVNWTNYQGNSPSGTSDGLPVLRNPVVARPETSHFGTATVTDDIFPIRQLTDAEVTKLVTEIATRIDARATPFTCLREFFADRVLNDAIAASGVNQALIDAANSSGDEHWLGAGQWVSPEKLAAALAPFLSARSDTFRIRAYGAVVNPITSQIEGEAWLEAVVQRFPELVTPSTRANELLKTIDTFGRRFKVVSFRWLSKDEI
jgi:Tfp pilus assembly protein PilX